MNRQLAHAADDHLPTSADLTQIIEGLRKSENGIKSLAVEYALEANYYLTKPGKPLPEKVQGLVQDDAVAIFKGSQVVFFAVADGRFRCEVNAVQTSERFDETQVHRAQATEAVFDGTRTTQVEIRTTADGTMHQGRSVITRRILHAPDPFDFTIHHLQGTAISDVLTRRGGRIVDQADWEDAATLVVETDPFTRNDGYTSKRRYWIDPARDFLVVRRQILQPQKGGEAWEVHHQIDCKEHNEIEEGIWLPTRVEITNHVVPDEGPPHLIAAQDLSISRWTVNQGADAEDFRLELDEKESSLLPVPAR